jgi:diazepam-binding inhibitor (GABA receptor modulating acyl-CoA-binding protein)
MEGLFNQAVVKVKDYTNVSTDIQLKLYGLYKQITIGNINISKSSFFDIKGNAKYTAWENLKNKSKESAMIEYIQIVALLNKK